MRVVNLADLQQFTAINLLSDPGHIGGPVVIPNAIQVVLNWTLADGKTGHNVLYGSVSGAFVPTPAIADALFNALSSGASWTAYAAFLSATTTFSGVTLRDVRSANLPLVNSTVAGKPGTNVGIALPNETSICVTLRTARTGIANRGRMYLPGFAVDQVTAANIIAPGTVTGTQNWVNNNFFAAFTGQSMTWSLGHPARAAYTGSTGTQHPARNAELVAITLGVVRDNHWDSQRRRGLK